MTVNDFAQATKRIEAALRPRPPRAIALEGFRRAAVLVPILSRAAGPTVLFTQRTDTLTNHPGQVSFPGGRFEKNEDAPAAALRESFEEVGLDPQSVEIAGVMDDQISVSNYVVTPVVGLIANPPAAFVRQESEVLEPFEIPLAALLDPAGYREERWQVDRMPPGAPVDAIMRQRTELLEYDAATSTYPVYFFDGRADRKIWGLTARILKDLLDLAFDFSRPS